MAVKVIGYVKIFSTINDILLMSFVKYPKTAFEIYVFGLKLKHMPNVSHFQHQHFMNQKSKPSIIHLFCREKKVLKVIQVRWDFP